MGAYVYIYMCVFLVYICIQIFKPNPRWEIFDRLSDTDAQSYLVQQHLPSGKLRGFNTNL